MDDGARAAGIGAAAGGAGAGETPPGNRRPRVSTWTPSESIERGDDCPERGDRDSRPDNGIRARHCGRRRPDPRSDAAWAADARSDAGLMRHQSGPSFATHLCRWLIWRMSREATFCRTRSFPKEIQTVSRWVTRKSYAKIYEWSNQIYHLLPHVGGIGKRHITRRMS